MPNNTSQPRTETNVSHAQEVAYRGVEKAFEFGFWQDDARLVPVIPGNSAIYPRIQIYDPDGEVYLTATPPAVQSSQNPGYWVYRFSTPIDADLTGIGEFWQFAAEILTAAGRHEVYRTTFSVHDPTVVKATNSERYYVVISGKGVRIMYRSLVELYNVEVEIPLGTAEDTYLMPTVRGGSGPYDIKQSQAGDGVYIYYLDIPYSKVTGFTTVNLTEGDWQVFWTIQESASEPGDLVYQFIKVLSRSALNFVPDVRFIVDKLEKRASSKQAIRDTDVFSGILRGLQLVNMTFPTTSWSVVNCPEQMGVFVVLGAAYWVYCGQLGLAVDLAFNFSGQQTVLDQDQTGGIESMLERYRAELRDQLTAVKTDFLRHIRPVGVVATRPTRARHLYNTVFKVSSQSSTTMIQFLNSLGLL